VQVTNGVCEAGADVNFELLGFTIEGVLTSAPGCAHLTSSTDVQIELRTESKPNVVAVAKLADDGAFRFTSVTPGAYEVRVQAGERALEHATQSVQVEHGNARLAQRVRVLGQRVSGSVVNNEHESSAPAAAVVVVTLQGNDVRARSTSVDAEHAYAFDDVPCGEYVLAATAGDKELTPRSLAVHVDARLPRLAVRTLLVAGDAVRGLVLAADRRTPLSDVSIVVTPLAATAADAAALDALPVAAATLRDGTFRVTCDEQRAAVCEIAARLPGVRFEPARLRVDARAPDAASADAHRFVASAVRVCGSVSTTPAGIHVRLLRSHVRHQSAL
jgi:hypothetical protein